ncbi:MAG: undecaprenyl-diphosphatase UppP [Cyanobacteria bacterium NC_groundwater_1444_Ag_S-0.65um_54_12]|nr:undecaprenyl-diphosphatase UppP [Cyanobacteria bacterium NC_groundwater_1444_Ag_S-0.65um_54_12]
MDIWNAIAFGVTQGITEFLPISSTAHLILLPAFFKWEDPGLAFDVALHLGTFLAVAWYFWRDLVDLCSAWFRSLHSPDLHNDPQQRLAWFVLIGCIPGGLSGVLLEHYAESTFRNPLLIGMAMVGFGLLMALAELLGRRTLDEKTMKWRQALAVGLAQAIAIIPGASRSGVTITAGLLTGLEREAAARFSFLLGVPIVFGAVAYKVKDLFHVNSDSQMTLLIGIVASTVMGYLSIKFLLAFLRKRSTGIFIVYRLLIGSMLVILALTQQIPTRQPQLTQISHTRSMAN